MMIGNSLEDMQEFIEENDVKFLRMQFCDINGVSRNVAVSDKQVADAARDGVLIDGNAVAGFDGRDRSDLVLRPFFETATILPWRPQRGKVASVICGVFYPDGRPCEADSRQVLGRQIARAEVLGYTMNVGAECEFYLFKQDDAGRPTTDPVDDADYCALAPGDRGENTRRDIILTLEDMGFVVESSHHETGRGHHEIDFRYTEALKAADQLMILRNVVRNIAQRNGQHATFMPKPLNGEPGSGMHVNLSLMRGLDNLFIERDGDISEEARHFAAGILAHMPGITALANPTVNSYKRLATGMEAPSRINWGKSAREALIRIPADAEHRCRMEVRSPDPTCNPYLTYAVMLAAGLDGLERRLPLPPETVGDAEIGVFLPMSLNDALGAMAADPLIAEVLGAELAEKFQAIKRAEWQAYMTTVHDWEQARYFTGY